MMGIFSLVTGLLGGGSPARAWITIGLAVALGAAALAGWLLLGRLQEANKTIGAQAQQIQQLAEAAEHNAEMFRRREQQAGTDMAAIQAELEAERAREPVVQTVIQRVIRYVPSDAQPAGCPAVPGPVLRALGGLRELRTAKAGNPN